MRQIGVLTTETEAQRLADYLLTLGVPTRVDAAGGTHAVWVLDENQVEQARQVFDEFLRDPSDPRFVAAQDDARKLRQGQAEAQRKARSNVVELGDRWRTHGGRGAPLTMLLIAVSIVITVWTQFGKNFEVSQWLWMSNLSPELPEIRAGQIWRLWTPMFLHLSGIHLLFNMYWLYVLGSMIEIRRGTLILAALVFSSQLLSGLAQDLWSGPGYGGMSGVGYALFGYCWMKSRFDLRAGIFVDPGTAFMMIAWLFICMTGSVGPVANGAHVAGLVVGMAAGYAPLLWRR